MTRKNEITYTKFSFIILKEIRYQEVISCKRQKLLGCKFVFKKSHQPVSGLLKSWEDSNLRSALSPELKFLEPLKKDFEI